MIGQPLPRVEDQRLVRGRGQYTDDVSLPDQVWAAFLRSPHAHARLLSIDATEALKSPGVLAVFTGRDYVEDGHAGIDHIPNPADAIDVSFPAFRHSEHGDGTVLNLRQWPLAVERVRHVGEAVAMVIAQTRSGARAAVDLLAVDYEELPAVVDAVEALTPEAPQLWDQAPGNLCFAATVGDFEVARRILDAAPHVVRRRFRNSRTLSCQMEPRSALGSWDEARQCYTLISGSQGAHRIKLGLVGALGVKPEQVRVVCPDVGGGFGARTMMYVEQLAVTWAARRMGRPVKWTADRSEAFLSDYQGRDQIIDAAVAFDRDGRILAVANTWTGNVGAHTVSYVPMSNGTRVMTTVYQVPVAAVHIRAALTNTVPTAPYRGAGRPEAHHVMERVLDVAARQLNLDRVEIRRRNLMPRTALPCRSPMGLTYDSGDFAGNMARALEMAQWDGFAERAEASRKAGRRRGIGLANHVEAPVGAPRERIEVHVLPDGRVEILSGTQSQGQGHETSFAQVVGSQLGVELSCIRLITGDTERIRLGGGSHSDRSMRIGGSLLLQACAQIIEQGRRLAAIAFGEEGAVEFSRGLFSSADGRQLPLQAVAAQAGASGLRGEAEFFGRMPAHPTGSSVCELEVDPDTGDVTLLNYVSVDDVGQPVNPMIVEGQVHGGLAQGIGQALSEWYYLDERSGQVLSGSFQDYGVPRAGALPRLDLALVEDATAGNALRVKGGGESGITPATAVIFNALAHALQDFGDDELPMPATAPRIWEWIHKERHGT